MRIVILVVWDSAVCRFIGREDYWLPWWHELVAFRTRLTAWPINFHCYAVLCNQTDFPFGVRLYSSCNFDVLLTVCAATDFDRNKFISDLHESVLEVTCLCLCIAWNYVHPTDSLLDLKIITTIIMFLVGQLRVKDENTYDNISCEADQS